MIESWRDSLLAGVECQRGEEEEEEECGCFVGRLKRRSDWVTKSVWEGKQHQHQHQQHGLLRLQCGISPRGSRLQWDQIPLGLGH